MTIYFTSDWHLGHKRIIELSYRPFATVEEMNEWLIESANRDATEHDTLIFNGDIAMGTIADTLPLFERVRARKVLKPGNHDRCSPLYEGYQGMPPEKVARLIAEWSARYEDVGFTITDNNWFTSDGVEAVLSHFPYDGDNYDHERYAAARPRDKGHWLIHGHTHGQWRQRGRQIDVGVDAWGGRLVPASTVAALIHDGPAMLDKLPWIP